MFGTIRNPSGEVLDYTFHAGAEGSRHMAVLGARRDRQQGSPLCRRAGRGVSGPLASTRCAFPLLATARPRAALPMQRISKEVEDLGAVLSALDGYSVCYVGHSMGGAVGVLCACRDERIGLLVSLAGMVHTHAFAEREFGEVVPGEGCMWEEPDYPLSQVYMDDMAQIDSVVRRVSEIVVPWLLVHGSEDDVVPLADSHDILARAGGNAELIVIDGGRPPSLARTRRSWSKRSSAGCEGNGHRPCAPPIFTGLNPAIPPAISHAKENPESPEHSPATGLAGRGGLGRLHGRRYALFADQSAGRRS